MPTKPILPEWGDCNDAVKARQPLTPLQQFVYDHEPTGLSDSEDFRKQLTAVVKTDLRLFTAHHAPWSDQVFGTPDQRGPISPLNHLAKEVAECLLHPGDIMEYADCLLLLSDAARRAGFSVEGLMEAAYKKLEINKARKWTKPANPSDAVEHDRSGESKP